MFFVIFFSAAFTIAIINNTIQLVIQSRKDEIEIMRLMGVSNWYIAVLPLGCVQGLLIKVHNFFLVPSPMFAQNIVIIVLLLIGTAFGASGSVLSIKKHLQV